MEEPPKPKTYHRRTIDDELDVLLTELPAIAVEGPKAVGKTATATQRATAIRDLEDPIQRNLAEADLDLLVSGAGTLLIDEWQRVPAVWDRVRRAVDAGVPPGRFLLAGSTSPPGLGTHSGAGRIVSLRMRPLSLAERFGQPPTVSVAELAAGGRVAVEGDSEINLERYADEIVASGFPGLRGLSPRAQRLQLDGYLRHVVDRDFPELGHAVRNPTGLRRWMAAYAAATATVASFETIRDAATGGQAEKPAKSTVLSYRDALERLFILDPVPAWQASRNHIAELTQGPKHHLADPALAARLLGMTSESLLGGGKGGPRIPRDGALLGALFESIVTLSLRVYARSSQAEIGHLRTKRGEHEVDLLLERGDGGILAFEVKLGGVVDDDDVRHLHWLAGKIGDDLLDAVVVTTGPTAYRRKDGVAVVPAALLGP